MQPLGLRRSSGPGALAVGALLEPTRVLGGDPLAAEEVDLAQRDEEALEVAHQNELPSSSRLRALTASASVKQRRTRPRRRRGRWPRPGRGSSPRPGPPCSDGDEQQPAEGDRDEQLPAEVHQLVVAVPGQRGPEPDVGEQEHEQLGRGATAMPSMALGMTGMSNRPPRAAQEQRDDDRRHHDGGQELGQVEHGETHRGVLGLVAADQLLLGLGEVERRPVHLGGDGQKNTRTARRRWRSMFQFRRPSWADRRCRWWTACR